MKYIPLDDLVTEIENRLSLISQNTNAYEEGRRRTYMAVLYLIDAIKVKDVDLDSDIRTYLTNHFNIYEDGVLQSKKSGLPLSTYDIIKVAKYFFELGIKTQKGE